MKTHLAQERNHLTFDHMIQDPFHVLLFDNNLAHYHCIHYVVSLTMRYYTATTISIGGEIKYVSDSWEKHNLYIANLGQMILSNEKNNNASGEDAVLTNLQRLYSANGGCQSTSEPRVWCWQCTESLSWINISDRWTFVERQLRPLISFDVWLSWEQEVAPCRNKFQRNKVPHRWGRGGFTDRCFSIAVMD